MFDKVFREKHSLGCVEPGNWFLGAHPWVTGIAKLFSVWPDRCLLGDLLFDQKMRRCELKVTLFRLTEAVFILLRVLLVRSLIAFKSSKGVTNVKGDWDHIHLGLYCEAQARFAIASYFLLSLSHPLLILTLSFSCVLFLNHHIDQKTHSSD